MRLSSPFLHAGHAAAEAYGDWVALQDTQNTGAWYYYNAKTQQSSWVWPPVAQAGADADGAHAHAHAHAHGSAAAGGACAGVPGATQAAWSAAAPSAQQWHATASAHSTHNSLEEVGKALYEQSAMWTKALEASGGAPARPAAACTSAPASAAPMCQPPAFAAMTQAQQAAWAQAHLATHSSSAWPHGYEAYQAAAYHDPASYYAMAAYAAAAAQDTAVGVAGDGSGAACSGAGISGAAAVPAYRSAAELAE
eukprot:6205771-Pleurochrysis_carterae.AAC.1